ncbi:MAG: response regulator [Fuerstiella sp.]
MGNVLSILLLEDNADHAALVCRSLSRGIGHDFRVEIVHERRLDTTLQQLVRRSFDAIITDLKLPDSPSHQTLQTIIDAVPDTPVVVMTSMEDADLGMNLVKQGAQDFLFKTQLDGPLITRSVLYAIERKRRESEQETHASELETIVTARTRYLELLLAVSDISHHARSNRDALQQTVAQICASLNLPFGTAVLLPDDRASAGVGIESVYRHEDASVLMMPAEDSAIDRRTRRQRAINSRRVVVEQKGPVIWLVLPVLTDNAVPALMEFRTNTPLSDSVSLVSVLERVCTQIAQVFARSEFQRAIEESAHLEQQSMIGDLHDGLSHELSGLTWLAHSHVLRLREADSEFLPAALELHNGLRNSLQLLRRSLHGMTSLALETEGLIPAVSLLVREASERFPCRCEFQSNADELPVSRFVAAQIYRIVQESLTNVGKHAQATSAFVHFLRQGGSLTVSISDNGKGVAGSEKLNSGLGFGIMRHRSRLIDGDLQFRKSASGGLLVRLEIPLPQES